MILKVKKILADKAYHSQNIRTYIDGNLYKKRQIVERAFQKLKSYIRIGTRYDKLSSCFSAFITLVAFIISQNWIYQHALNIESISCIYNGIVETWPPM